MTRIVDMKRIGAMALALLIALAVAGPVCLMFASSVMAMPMEVQSSACDDRGSTMCPYERPDGTLGVKAPPVDLISALALTPASEAPVVADPSAIAGDGDRGRERPPAHLTPLRI